MFWRVRTILDDRPGALAALSTACARQDVNILGLQIFPTTGERVLDELVMRTPPGWTFDDVEALCTVAGASLLDAVPCTAKALEDQPVRYLRAAARVLEEPDRLEEQLGQLYDGVGSGGGTLVRAATDTEQAREVHLRRVAAIGSRLTARAPQTVELRPGTAADIAGVLAMLDRSSFVVDAAAALLPRNGESLVLTRGDQVIAVGSLAPGEDGLVVQVRVEDAEQQRGHGTRLLRALALAAADRGASSISLAGADHAVLPLVRAAGLQARAARGRLEVPLRATGTTAPTLTRMSEVTVPMVALLARRPDLRDAYPTAGFIDAAIRDGA